MGRGEPGKLHPTDYARGGAISFIVCQLMGLPGSLDSSTYMKIALVKFSESYNEKCHEYKKWIYGIRDR